MDPYAQKSEIYVHHLNNILLFVQIIIGAVACNRKYNNLIKTKRLQQHGEINNRHWTQIIHKC